MIVKGIDKVFLRGVVYYDVDGLDKTVKRIRSPNDSHT